MKKYFVKIKPNTKFIKIWMIIKTIKSLIKNLKNILQKIIYAIKKKQWYY